MASFKYNLKEKFRSLELLNEIFEPLLVIKKKTSLYYLMVVVIIIRFTTKMIKKKMDALRTMGYICFLDKISDGWIVF